MNQTCECCNCRCCGFCILLCWVIFGLIGGVMDFMAVGSGTEFSTCPTSSAYYDHDDPDKPCCGWVVQDQLVLVGSSCDKYDTSVTIGGVNDILGVLAGVVGIIGLVQYT